MEGLVHQEVLLLGAHGGDDPGDVLVAEELQDAHGLLVQGFHGAEEGGLFVQGLAAVGIEDGGDAQGVVFDEGVGGGVPGGVASRLKGGAEAAGGEGGGIGLALDQLFAGELHDDGAVALGGDEAVVLLGGDAGHGLEPVGIMGAAFFHGPVLHGVGDDIGDGLVQALAVLHGFFQSLVGLFGETLLHDAVVEDHVSKGFGHVAHKSATPLHSVKDFPPARRGITKKTPRTGWSTAPLLSTVAIILRGKGVVNGFEGIFLEFCKVCANDTAGVKMLRIKSGEIDNFAGILRKSFKIR